MVNGSTFQWSMPSWSCERAETGGAGSDRGAGSAGRRGIFAAAAADEARREWRETRGGEGYAPRVYRVGSVLSYRRRRYRLRRHPEAARLPPRPWSLRGTVWRRPPWRTRKEGAADAPKHEDYRHYKDVIVRLEIIQKARFIRAAKRDCLPCGINLAGVGISRDQKRATTVRYAIGDEVSPLRTAPPAPHDREFESFPRGQSTATPRSPTARENAHDSPSRSHAVTPGAGFVSVNNDRSDVRLSRVSRGRERDASRRCASNSRRRATRERCDPSRATRRGVRRRVFGRLADGADVRRNIRADVGFRSVGARASVARRAHRLERVRGGCRDPRR